MASGSRPFLVTLVALLYLLMGLITLIGGVIGMNIPGIVMGVVTLVISIGFFKGWSLWWYIGIIFTIINIVLGLLSLNILTIIVGAIILWYLFRPNVKSFFLG